MKVYKVYGCNLDGIYRGVVAAKSKTAGAKALNLKYHYFNVYGSQTWNKEEITKAMETPGKAWKYKQFGSENWLPLEATE